MRPTTTAAAILLAALGVSGVAHAQPRPYRGPHPIDLDGHWHLEETTHVHDRLAVGLEPFGDVDGVLVFLADPVAYGYAGDVWTYRGAHPLPGGMRGYCALSEEHRHPFAPEGEFRRQPDGSHLYVGAMRGGIEMIRPGRTMPRHPIVVATPVVAGTPGGLTPFYSGGCMHTWMLGPGDRPLAVPFGGCVPRALPPRGARPSAAPPAARGPLPGETTYTRFSSRPGRSTPRPPPRAQND